ncbi:MAG: DHH family phosphoesterase [Christensenellaceae bacterium]|jgi:phosphoesterase RecJ-like protein
MNKISDFIRKFHKYAVVTHQNPDGDALGSAYALAEVINNLGKSAEVILLCPPPDKYDFPVFSNMYKLYADADFRAYDAIIAVDCAAASRLGEVERVFFSLPNANIDHHISNTNYAQVNFVLEAPATGILVFDIMKFLQTMCSAHTDDIVRHAIYIAIAADTGNFTFSNTTSRCFEVCAELMLEGLDLPHTADRIFNRRSIGATKLIACFIDNIRLHYEGRLAVSVMMLDDIGRLGAKVEDCENLINYGRDIEGVEISIFIREMKENIYKISFRSKEYADVSEFASRYGGGGHIHAAGCRMEGNLYNVLDLLVKTAGEYLR